MNIENLKSIEFVFENCESFKVDGKDVELLKLNILNNDTDNPEVKSTDDVEIELNIKANETYYPFDVPNSPFETTKFKRIDTYKDITSLILEDNNGNIDSIHCEWKWEGDDCSNQSQLTRRLENGNLYISINKDNELYNKYNISEQSELFSLINTLSSDVDRLNNLYAELSKYTY